MINTTTSMSSSLASIYSTTNESLNKVLGRIATGKRIQTPGDDFAGYIRGSALQTDINAFKTLKQGMQDGKSYTDYGIAVGNNILTDLTKMKDLATSYANLVDPAGNDADEAAALTAQFTSLQNSIDSQITNSMYDGTQIYDTGLAQDVSIDIDGNVITITPTDAADASALDITAGTAVQDVADQMTAAQQYITDMTSFGDQISRAVKLADTVINSKTATVSAIMDINETEELANLTNLQVRQQAAVSMMAQSNSAQAAIAKLFQ